MTSVCVLVPAFLHCRLRPISSLSRWSQIQIFTPEIILDIVQLSRFSAIRACLLFISQKFAPNILAIDKIAQGIKTPATAALQSFLTQGVPMLLSHTTQIPLVLRSSLALFLS